MSQLIEVYKRIFNFKDSLFNISKKSDKDIFNVLISIFLNNIYDKLDTYKLQNIEINEIKFFLKFKDYLKPIEGKSLFLDFTTPYDNIKWTSKWKIIFESKEFYFEGIDIFLDSYVKNKNFTYNITMNKDIELFSKRINYLKNNQFFYFNIISKNIKDITERMFDVFPYSIIVKDYKDLILNSDLVYKPKILRNKNISNITENYFLLSVIPDYLSSYLLGFPVISIDIPSASTLQKYMEKLDNLGEEKYFNYISENFNLLKIKSSTFNIESGNAIESDGTFVDLCYNKIIDYNQDDIVSLLNNNVIHYFSCKEFKTILKKRENPYNRQEFNIFYHILENLKFKNKIKKRFSHRGLQLEINGTMMENFEELKEKIVIEKEVSTERSLISNEIEMLYQPLIEMFFNSDRFNLEN